MVQRYLAFLSAERNCAWFSPGNGAGHFDPAAEVLALPHF
jgi:hypothetical protein